MSEVFETSTKTVRVNATPFSHTVKNVSSHEVTVEVKSNRAWLEVTPANLKLEPTQSLEVDFFVTGEGAAGGTAEITFSSGSETATLALEVDANLHTIGGHCFDGATFVLLADGPARAIRELAIGDELRTVDELGHLTAKQSAVRATITDVMRHDVPNEMFDVLGVAVTATHRWAVRDPREPGFVTTAKLDPVAHQLLAIDHGHCVWLAVPIATALPTAETVWNLTTTARTFAVGASVDGPFFVVHNSKRDDGSDTGLYDPPLDPRLKPP
jgi:hypothetical protein